MIGCIMDEAGTVLFVFIILSNRKFFRLVDDRIYVV